MKVTMNMMMKVATKKLAYRKLGLIDKRILEKKAVIIVTKKVITIILMINTNMKMVRYIRKIYTILIESHPTHDTEGNKLPMRGPYNTNSRGGEGRFNRGGF